MIGTDLTEKDALHDYSSSVHGRSLEEKGLLSVAICTDCHTTHHNLKQSDENSSVHPNNLAATCGKCHKGIVTIDQTLTQMIMSAFGYYEAHYNPPLDSDASRRSA